MAKKKKNTFHRGTDRWQAAPNDAIRLAALRWFALTIEKWAIELYATDATTYPKMVKALRHALNDLRDIRDDARQDEDDCPEGYVLCDDGVCAPSCDRLTEPADNS